jgi:hypothetical protein
VGMVGVMGVMDSIESYRMRLLMAIEVQVTCFIALDSTTFFSMRG